MEDGEWLMGSGFEQGFDELPDGFLNFILGRGGIDDLDSLRVLFGQVEKPLPDPAIKLFRFLLHAVGLVDWTHPAAPAVEADGMIKVKDNRMAKCSCEHCPDTGACCRYFQELVVGVLLTDEEALKLQIAITTRIGSFLPLKSSTGECLHLDEKGTVVCNGAANL